MPACFVVNIPNDVYKKCLMNDAYGDIGECI